MKVALVYPRWDWIEYNGLAEPVGLLQLVSSLRNAHSAKPSVPHDSVIEMESHPLITILANEDGEFPYK